MADEVSVKVGETPSAGRSSYGDAAFNRLGSSGFGALSPLQATLLYGGLASTVLGPLGLLVGAGAGILSNRLKKNFLDREAADAASTRSEYKGVMNELDKELAIADPEERRLLTHAQRIATEGWYRLQSGDESGRAMVEQANAMSRGIMTADRDARKQEASAQAGFQRGLIGNAANDYRQQYLANISQVEDLDKQATRVLSLTADPNFDPNKPFNKAILAEMLSTGISGMYRDSPDVLDALTQGAGGIGAILGAARGPAGAAVGNELGTIIGAITGGIKSKDFQVSREEYNRVAMNLKRTAQQYGQQRMQRLSTQARDLDTFARSTGAIPQDYSLGDYISGGVKELRLTPVPQYPSVKQTTSDVNRLKALPGRAPPSERYVPGVNNALRGLERWMNQRKRPTN